MSIWRHDYVELDARLRSGDIKAAIEILPGSGRDIERGRPTFVAVAGAPAQSMIYSPCVPVGCPHVDDDVPLGLQSCQRSG